MQVLILYYSKGGNTKKLAEEVAKGVESAGAKAILRNTGAFKLGARVAGLCNRLNAVKTLPE